MEYAFSTPLKDSNINEQKKIKQNRINMQYFCSTDLYLNLFL